MKTKGYSISDISDITGLTVDEIENYQKDEHAPFCLRVNGNVYLMDEFYRLFNIKSGQMYLDPKDRIEIW